jgi:hypothetical protein
LPGAVARSKGAGLARRVAQLLDESRGEQREGLIEALSELGAPGLGALGELSRALDPADRAKVAEVLGARTDAAAILRRLAVDRVPAVRAAAVWSLGSAGAAPDLALLRARLDDRAVSVAANAAGALGRLSKRTGGAPSPILCPALEHPWAPVRANALVALRLAGATCDQHTVIDLVARDPSPLVRLAAARALAASPHELARDALARCADEDESSRVASACVEPAPAAPERAESVLVFVVPTGESETVPRAPFALLFADGLHRLGLADRRGALWERRAPAGSIELSPLGGAYD